MGSRWKFWSRDKGDGKEDVISSLTRLEKDGILRVLTTDVLEHRVGNLHDGLKTALATFREGSMMEIIPGDLLEKLPEKERVKLLKQAIQGVKKKREALDDIVVLLTDSAWPWNRGGDRQNKLMAFIVDEFLQDYEELKTIPEFYDDLYTMALSIQQKSYRGEDVTKEVPIVILTPQGGKGFDPGMMAKIKMGRGEGEQQ